MQLLKSNANSLAGLECLRESDKSYFSTQTRRLDASTVDSPIYLHASRENKILND